MPKRDKEWEEFAELLLHRDEVRPTGPGWYNHVEIQERLHVKRNAASRWVSAAMKRGELEEFRGAVYRDGRLFSMKWYRRKRK